MTEIHWRDLCYPTDANPPATNRERVSRARFYAMCAREFGFEGWCFNREESSEPIKPGRDGRPSEVEKYGSPGIASFRDNAADAMQWLILKGHLNSRVVGPHTDEALEIAWAEGRGRINTANELAELFETAELTPLRSPDLESVPSGTFGPRTIGMKKLQAMKAVQDLRRDIPPLCMGLLEAIICRNDFLWAGLPKKDAENLFQAIRASLDFAAWSLNQYNPRAEITEEVMIQRWPWTEQWFIARRLRGKVVMSRMDTVPS